MKIKIILSLEKIFQTFKNQLKKILYFYRKLNKFCGNIWNENKKRHFCKFNYFRKTSKIKILKKKCNIWNNWLVFFCFDWSISQYSFYIAPSFPITLFFFFANRKNLFFFLNLSFCYYRDVPWWPWFLTIFVKGRRSGWKGASSPRDWRQEPGLWRHDLLNRGRNYPISMGKRGVRNK